MKVRNLVSVEGRNFPVTENTNLITVVSIWEKSFRKVVSKILNMRTHFFSSKISAGHPAS